MPSAEELFMLSWMLIRKHLYALHDSPPSHIFVIHMRSSSRQYQCSENAKKSYASKTRSATSVILETSHD